MVAARALQSLRRPTENIRLSKPRKAHGNQLLVREDRRPDRQVKAYELLWPGTEVYQRRFEKSGVALIAVQRALSDDPGIVGGVDEFLKLYEWVRRADAQAFTRVWSDPVAYFWVRRAVHFLAACRGEPMGTVERAYCAEVGADKPTRRSADSSQRLQTVRPRARGSLG